MPYSGQYEAGTESFDNRADVHHPSLCLLYHHASPTSIVPNIISHFVDLWTVVRYWFVFRLKTEAVSHSHGWPQVSGILPSFLLFGPDVYMWPTDALYKTVNNNGRWNVWNRRKMVMGLCFVDLFIVDTYCGAPGSWCVRLSGDVWHILGKDAHANGNWCDANESRPSVCS